MSNEEFEDLFGNVPFENIEKIKKYINENYVSKDELRKILKENSEYSVYLKIIELSEEN